MAWTNGSSRTSTPAWKALRKEARDAIPYECAWCMRDGKTNAEPLVLDHIVPVAEGGQDELDNAQWICPGCHARKTSEETARGIARRKARRHLPVERHPGLR